MSRTPPADIEAEMSVLGSVLLDNESMTLIHDHISAEDFYKEAHRKIWHSMLGLYTAHEPIDMVTLAERLRRDGALEGVGNIAYIIGLADSTPTAAYVESYAAIIHNKRIMRDIISGCGALMREAYEQQLGVDEIITLGEKTLLQAASLKNGANFRDMPELSASVAEQLKALQDKGETVGLSTGFKDLDRAIGGLEPGSLYILAARPAMGKTALALSLAYNAALAGSVGAFFSLEMSGEQLVKRLLGIEGRIDGHRLRSGELSDRDWQRATSTLAKLAALGLHIDDASSLAIGELRSRARRLATRHPLGFVVVDYLQLLDAPGGNREQEISAISRGLKGLARELNIPVLALSQLNRSLENRPNKRPMLSDLRESGAIEQDADTVMFIYRDEYYDPHSEKQGIAEIILGKQRNGPTGTVMLSYLDSHTRFSNMATPEQVTRAENYMQSHGDLH